MGPCSTGSEPTMKTIGLVVGRLGGGTRLIIRLQVTNLSQIGSRRSEIEFQPLRSRFCRCRAYLWPQIEFATKKFCTREFGHQTAAVRKNVRECVLLAANSLVMVEVVCREGRKDILVIVAARHGGSDENAFTRRRGRNCAA